MFEKNWELFENYTRKPATQTRRWVLSVAIKTDYATSIDHIVLEHCALLGFPHGLVFLFGDGAYACPQRMTMISKLLQTGNLSSTVLTQTQAHTHTHEGVALVICQANELDNRSKA